MNGGSSRGTEQEQRRPASPDFGAPLLQPARHRPASPRSIRKAELEAAILRPPALEIAFAYSLNNPAEI
jgi:hypothetical protein